MIFKFFPIFFLISVKLLYTTGITNIEGVLSVTWVLRSAIHRKDIFCHLTSLLSNQERGFQKCVFFLLQNRDFESHITHQTLLSVLAVRMWSYLTLILTKCKSPTVPLIADLLKRTKTHLREPTKGNRIALNFTNQPWLEMAKEGIVHIKKKSKATKLL